MSDSLKEYNEDTAICQCGHPFRDHTGKAWNYSCCEVGCKCLGFHAALPDSDTRPPSETPGKPPEWAHADFIVDAVEETSEDKDKRLRISTYIRSLEDQVASLSSQIERRYDELEASFMEQAIERLRFGDFIDAAEFLQRNFAWQAARRLSNPDTPK